MNYRDIYFSRITHLGETATEVALKSNIRSFERWLAGSPFTVDNLSVERGLYFSGIIQTSKDKEEKKIMYLYVANDIPIQVGDILTWIQDNGTIEKWLLLSKVHGVHDAYQTFQIIKCNYNLKWIDKQGYLHQSWAYAVSSVDSQVKGNFRMWHSLISPQPNKFAEIIMPRPLLKENTEDVDELMRGINFIIENEGWVVIECDWTSVEGIVYMSLTESKVNYQYDDRDIDVADTDRYKFPELPTLYKVGDKIEPIFEEGTLNQWEINLSVSDESECIDENFNAIAPGQCMITMSLKNRPAVTKEVEVTINALETEPVYYISGPSELRLDRQHRYYLTDGVKLETGEERAISVDSMIIQEDPTAKNLPSDYGTLVQDVQDNKIFILHANKKNKIGKLVLIATHNNVEYTKTVEIVPLW